MDHTALVSPAGQTVPAAVDPQLLGFVHDRDSR
jgi:hypothetical protein